ncbi:efflux RND transporter periplasmic adaptor subunit [Sulfurimonas sp. HSL-1716]|uniref:efflux RND transporter periplasmic adaptor subunit n=1 Tax=Hydrocurvibacter sulfurireducens TaxID=3131937 RepID=UPI0031F8054F
MNKIFLIIGLLTSLYAFGAEDDDRVPPVRENHVKVSVVIPKKADMNIPIEVQGTTEAVAKHILNAPFEGILHTKVTNTQKVNKGAVIAIIQNQTLFNRVNRLSYDLTLYKEQLILETKKLQSIDEMLQMGLISKNDYLTQRSLVNEKKLLLSNTQNELDDLKQRKARGVIHSPVEGYISDLQAEGSYLTYAAPICRVDDANAYVRLFIPALYAKNIQKGQNVVIHLQGSSVKAVISQILPNTTNNLVEAIAAAKTPLSLGLNVQADIQTKNKHGWILPKEAIVLVQNRPAVFIIKNDVAHVHFIDVQKDMIDKVLVTDNLSEDDRIAYKNAYMLEENSVVEVTR